MKEFLVCYDLRSTKDDNPDYEKLIGFLESLKYCRVQQSVWIISYEDDNMTREKLFDMIIQYVNDEDSLFVGNYGNAINYHGTHDNFKNCFNDRPSLKEYKSITKCGSKLKTAEKLAQKIKELEKKLTNLANQLETTSNSEQKSD